jgi:putative transposase
MALAFRSAPANARRPGTLDCASLLAEEPSQRAVGRARWFGQGWVATPALTLGGFRTPSLSPAPSDRDALAPLMAWRLGRGRRPCAADPGAYGTARDRLPEEADVPLARDRGRAVDEPAPRSGRWLGHRMLTGDGSPVPRADTAAHQAA